MSFQRVISKLGALFRRREPVVDLDEEIRAHLEMEERENLETGMSAEEAHYAALRRFGNVPLAQERSREMWGWNWVETLWQDVRFALRMLAKNPGFTTVAVLTLALGIGANAGIFTVIRSVLLKPLDYPEPNQLVEISGGATSIRFEEMRSSARSYSGVGAFRGGMETATLSGGAGPEVLNEARVSANFLRVLGVDPVQGRSFLADEDTPGGPSVAMISAELWQRQFGGDPRMVGNTVALDATPYTIIGVLPPKFQFPFPGVDVWVTRPYFMMTALTPYLEVFGRLKPQVSIGQATAELAVLNRQYNLAHPGMLDSNAASGERVIALKDSLVTDARSMLWMLFGVVGFVLLIACANVASLLLARAIFRTREFAVRAALGAGRGRLIGQLLAESLLLAAAGGALGVLLAKWSLSGITRMAALDLPRMGEIRLDGMVLGFAVVLSVVTGVLFGLVPSLGVSRPDLVSVLKASGEEAPSGSPRRRALWFSGPGLTPRGLLVAGQIALSMVLLIGATLLMKSLARLQRADPGFQPSNLLTMQISLPPSRYDMGWKKAAFFDELARRVQSLPGVRSAAATLTLPLTGFARTPVQLATQPPEPLDKRPLAIIQDITPAYFQTLGIPLRRGREFAGHDNLDSERVAIIDEKFARLFWPAYPSGPNPIGQSILIGANPRPAEIVGIVADVHQALEIDSKPGVYCPFVQNPLQAAMFAVRTESNPLRFVHAVRGEVLGIDRDQPVSAVKTMDDLVEDELGQRRLILMLLGSFAGLALLLVVIGIYGVIAYSTARRTHEVGIRRALGAHQADILRLVMGQGLGLTLAGIVMGIGMAFALTRVIRGLLFHVSPTDPASFLGAALLIVLVAVGASYIPARRATRVDPMVALRHE
jgi:predicted permease